MYVIIEKIWKRINSAKTIWERQIERFYKLEGVWHHGVGG